MDSFQQKQFHLCLGCFAIRVTWWSSFSCLGQFRWVNIGVSVHHFGDSGGPWMGITDLPMMERFAENLGVLCGSVTRARGADRQL